MITSPAATAPRGDTARRPPSRQSPDPRGARRMIDCDVHQNFRSIHDLLPYMAPEHREHVSAGGYGGIDFPGYPWSHPEGFLRRDATPPGGGPAGSDYETLRAQLLDPYDIDYAILTGEEILTASAMPSPHLAGAICSAYNDWLI